MAHQEHTLRLDTTGQHDRCRMGTEEVENNCSHAEINTTETDALISGTDNKQDGNAGNGNIAMEIHNLENDSLVRNNTMDREAISWRAAWFLCAVYIAQDSSRQAISYAIKYYNNDVYPVPQSILVAIPELMKLVMVATYMLHKGTLFGTRLSILFAVPSILYAVNNNMFLYALHYTTPPVWNVLLQMRLILTALVYRFAFSRTITRLQWLALLMLISAIGLARITSSETPGEGNFIKPFAIVLSFISSILGVCAGLTMEYLFKNDKRNFVEQQLQLYFFGSIISTSLCYVELDKIRNIKPMSSSECFYIAICLLLTATSGLSVASLMKRLDNIVKMYTQILSNMTTSIICAFLFPTRFMLGTIFFIALLFKCTAIVLYEIKTIDIVRVKNVIFFALYSLQGSLRPVHVMRNYLNNEPK